MEKRLDIGIDIGKRRLALGWPYAKQSASIDLNKPGIRSQELSLLASWLRETIPSINVRLWIETPYASHGKAGSQAGLDLSETVGMIMAAAAWDQVTMVGQSTWKARVCGSGKLQKLEVADWLAINHPDLFEKTMDDEDRIDAMCIGLYGKMRSEGLVLPPVKTPRKKRKVANQDSNPSGPKNAS